MKIVKISVAVAALMLGCIGVSKAADLPARMAPAPYIAPLPIFTWTGAYFGINAGGAFDFESRATNAGLNPTNNGIALGERPGTAAITARSGRVSITSVRFVVALVTRSTSS